MSNAIKSSRDAKGKPVAKRVAGTKGAAKVSGDSGVVTAPKTQPIALSLLVPSPKNVRKTGGQDVAALAASILAQGVIQNLNVEVQKDAKGKLTGRFEVVAGGRRLKALQSLLKTKKIGPDYPVECKVCDEDQAIEVSTAENLIREAMHPADQFQAFQDLLNQNRSIEDVALRFGCSIQTVRQRLKLANVAPSLVQAFRKGDIELEQMMAFAITNDHERQCRVWEQAEGWQRRAEQLRRMLTQGEIEGTDRVALFVGMDAYEAAGGVVRKDLFTEGSRGIYFADAELLERLATEKLAVVVGEVQAEGWRWVEARTNLQSSEMVEYGRSTPTRRKATDAELALDGALQAELHDLQAITDDETTSETDYSVAAERIDAIETELADLLDARMTYSAKSKKLAGAMVSIRFDGAVEIQRGLIRKDDKKAAAKEAQEKDGGQGVEDDAKTGKISDALCHSLTAHKTLAMQALMQSRPDVALVATVHSLLTSAVLEERWINNGIEIKAAPDRINIEGGDAEAFSSKAGIACMGGIAAVKEQLPEDMSTLLDWLFDQDQVKLLELLAVAVSATVNAVRIRDGETNHATEKLASRLNLDMADWWEPTGTNYLTRVNKDEIMRAVEEGVGADEAASLKSLKKGEAAERAGELLKNKRWLPRVLRAE